MPNEDVDEIHIVLAGARWDGRSGTYPCYKNEDAFILHYPAKYNTKGKGVRRRFILEGYYPVPSCVPFPMSVDWSLDVLYVIKIFH